MYSKMFLDNISHIYCLYSDERDINSFVFKKYINISYKKYDFRSEFKNRKYFRDIAIYECLLDAYRRKYDKICFLTPDIKIIDENIIENINDYNIFCLNPRDVNKDCVILNSFIISYIIENVKITSFTTACWKENFYKRLSDNFKVFYPEKNYVKHKVDFVLTYVNDNDENWKKTYKETFGNLDYNSIRFKDYGTLEELVLGIRKNAKFIDDIYIIVQNKSEINISCNDIKIIEHKDIIPNKLLPTFNSCTIEMFLGNIPGLSEYFIYGNDDMFFVNDVEESEFFEDGKLCVSLMNLDKSNLMYHKVVQNSFKLFFNEFDYTYFKDINLDKNYKNLKHVPHPIRKSTWHHIYNTQHLHNSCSILRDDKNLNQYIYIFYEYFIGNVKETSLTNEYIKNELKWKNDTKIICVNEYIDGLKEKLKYNLDIKVALCAIAKNENLYIREWVEHYKNIGIAKIFLYDNNDIDGERFEEVINDYIESGYVEVIDVRGVEKGLVYDKEGINLQPKCYIDCYENKVKDFDFVCFFDIDEFLTFNKDWDLFSFLKQDWIKDTDTILVPWLMFTDNDLLKYDNRPVMERFTEAIFDKSTGVKSIVKTNKNFDDFFTTYDCLIHVFIPNKFSNVKFINGKKVEFNLSKKNLWKSYFVTNNDLIRLNHYRTKTCEEYIKRQLGRHWGTNWIRSKKSRTINDCFNEFFKYNFKTVEKLKYFNQLNNQLNTSDKSDKIVITLTTYPARDKYLYDVLYDLNKNQTIKPDKIYLFLAEEEYNKFNLSDNIKKCIQNNLCEIIFTKNSYCHKRHEVFNFEYDSFVITIDDDMIYPTTYIEELYNYSKLNKCITQYIGFYDNYDGIYRKPIYDNTISYNLPSNLSGATICFPPQSFPKDALNFNNIRDIICPKCDESWIQPFLLKENKKIHFLHNWKDKNKLFKTIDGSQETTMHKIMSNKLDEIRYREQCFCNVITFLSIENKINNIWPNLDINKCTNIKILKNDKYVIILDKITGEILNKNDYKKYLKNFPISAYKKKINIDNPITIQDKIQWLKINDVSYLKARCADKILVHEYCKEKLGKDICIPILKIFENVNDINLNELPDKFVIKSNHGYNMNIICYDKQIFNLEKTKEKCNNWLNDDFGLRSLQLHYSLIDRKCFAEKFMTNGDQGLTDYKFWCQNGKPMFIMVINDRFNGKDKIHANVYDINWKPFHLGWSTFQENWNILDKKPETYDLMIEYAKKLSEDFKFVRVDFYEINGICYLGELTFTPGNGGFSFSEENNIKYGDLLKLTTFY